jgi:hypothetical protein
LEGREGKHQKKMKWGKEEISRERDKRGKGPVLLISSAVSFSGGVVVLIRVKITSWIKLS